MNGVADDVEVEKGRVDDDTEEKIVERIEKRALVDGGGLQSKHTWKTLKNAKRTNICNGMGDRMEGARGDDVAEQGDGGKVSGGRTNRDSRSWRDQRWRTMDDGPGHELSRVRIH